MQRSCLKREPFNRRRQHIVHARFQARTGRCTLETHDRPGNPTATFAVHDWCTTNRVSVGQREGHTAATVHCGQRKGHVRDTKRAKEEPTEHHSCWHPISGQGQSSRPRCPTPWCQGLAKGGTGFLRPADHSHTSHAKSRTPHWNTRTYSIPRPVLRRRRQQYQTRAPAGSSRLPSVSGRGRSDGCYIVAHTRT